MFHSEGATRIMTPQDLYIGPQFQLPPPVQPDYEAAMQYFKRLGHQIGEWFSAVGEGFKQAIQPIIDIFVNVCRNIEPVPIRPRLRLKRHRTQHERRIAWKIAHPFEPIHINNRLMAQRKMRLAYA
jgi:hypothetical protein